ncbi:peptidoglycan D,D-transpeptidase FtsI family protein [Bifidobacterium bombi]|uniref:Peptidoglycan synthetase, penicillin-binding protein n=1 Tax=Bifidobacterium bombi DSM 19703 TaxID=1341695 RepID=A0A080N2P4_9BIFI|nr:penicillin-binding protein 2 [Bifidobacterium bombi]KFF31278.1 peptidoglycan synthetase, penicillin-binding protein [Bifidobacterium bombi DSM 19703]
MKVSARAQRKTLSFFKRCMAIMIVLVLVAAACFVQLVNVQLLNGKATANAATEGRIHRFAIQSRRGRILDTNGAVLASSVERYTIIGDPERAQNFEPVTCTKGNAELCNEVDGKPVGVDGVSAVARILAPSLGMSAMEIGAKLSVTGHYQVLKTNVEPKVKRQIDKLNLGDTVYAVLTADRVYSDGTLLGPLLGGMKTDDKGKTTGASGIEAMKNAELSGTDGYKINQYGEGGQEIPGTSSEYKAPKDGNDVKLTIDADVDWFVKKVLVEGKEQYHADWALACVEDTRTHEIIALDDSDQIQAGSAEAKMGASRAVSETFEPGSIGKVFSIAGMMQNGVRQASDKFSVPYQIQKNGQTFHDALPHPTSNWTLAGILRNSSNVGMVMAGNGYTSQQRYDNLAKFGIGQPGGLNLPGESQGKLDTPDHWDGRTKDTVLFGQGYATNVLQLTKAITTVADGGVAHKQFIFKSSTDENGHVTDERQDDGERVIDQQVANETMNAMESATGGYERRVAVNGYRIASKTGTAEVRGSGNSLSSIVATFSGVIPADSPRFTISVILKNPDGIYAESTTAPMFKRIAEFLMQKYEVPFSAPRTDAIPINW